MVTDNPRRMRWRFLTIAITALMVPLSFIDAPYPRELVLQHVPTLLGIVLLAIATIRIQPTTPSFACVIGFLWLHILGARWIYSYVPYDDWARSLAGSTISETFGWQRNHYDRFVHFASGVLGVAPVSELLRRYGGMRPRGAALLAVASVLAIGAAYEILEWQLAVVLSPEQADAYNGQQGDVWDPQKDMALALLGAIVVALPLSRWRIDDW